MPIVPEEARKALEIDSSLAEAHAMLAIVAGIYDYDWKEAEKQFNLAMAHDPIPARVHQWYGFFYLMPLGRMKEALAHTEQGLKEDPLNVAAQYGFACCLFSMGRLEEAQMEMHAFLELEESLWIFFVLLAITYAAQERWIEALQFAEKASSFFLPAVGILAGVLKHMGEASRAEELIQKLMPGDAYGAPAGLASFYAMCGETEKAADWLEKSIEQRHPFEMTDYFVRSFLRSTPRWPALARLMNLPEEAG